MTKLFSIQVQKMIKSYLKGLFKDFFYVEDEHYFFYFPFLPAFLLSDLFFASHLHTDWLSQLVGFKRAILGVFVSEFHLNYVIERQPWICGARSNCGCEFCHNHKPNDLPISKKSKIKAGAQNKKEA